MLQASNVPCWTPTARLPVVPGPSRHVLVLAWEHRRLKLPFCRVRGPEGALHFWFKGWLTEDRRMGDSHQVVGGEARSTPGQGRRDSDPLSVRQVEPPRESTSGPSFLGLLLSIETPLKTVPP